jgi:hypothetical protein
LLFIVFYYHSTSEIWPHMREVEFDGGGPCKKETIKATK